MSWLSIFNQDKNKILKLHEKPKIEILPMSRKKQVKHFPDHSLTNTHMCPSVFTATENIIDYSLTNTHMCPSVFTATETLLIIPSQTHTCVLLYSQQLKHY